MILRICPFLEDVEKASFFWNHEYNICIQINRRFIMKRTQGILFLFFLFLFLFGRLPYLEAQLIGSRSVSQEDLQRMVESKMYMTQVQKNQMNRYPLYFNDMFKRFIQNVKQSMENFRLRQGNNRAIREQVQMRMDAIKEQTRLLKQRQESLYANRQDQLRQMKERMESLAQQRKDFIDFQKGR